MRRHLFSAFTFLLLATLTHAAETSSSQASQAKNAPKPSELSSTSSSSKEGSKPRKATKEKPPSTPGDKASQSEDERFTAARKAAYEDTRVADLRAKVDASKNDESANKAMRSYLKALYGRMRSIEPSLEERINMTEAAALRAIPQ